MVGSSFVDESYESYFVDLDCVDRYLQRNPRPRDRALTQRFLCDVLDTTPESVQQCRREISGEGKATNESPTNFEEAKLWKTLSLKTPSSALDTGHEGKLNTTKAETWGIMLQTSNIGLRE